MSSQQQTTPSSSTQTSGAASVVTSRVRPPRFYMLRGFIRRLLPLMFIAVLLITGTVVLVYSVVNKQALPPRFIIGSYITLGIIIATWCFLRFIYVLRMRYANLGVDDPEAGMRRLDQGGGEKGGGGKNVGGG